MSYASGASGGPHGTAPSATTLMHNKEELLRDSNEHSQLCAAISNPRI